MMESRLQNQLGTLEFQFSRARLWRQLMFCWATTAGVELSLFLIRNFTGWSPRPLWWLVLIGGLSAAWILWKRERRRPADFRALVAFIARKSGSPPFAFDRAGAGAGCQIRRVWIPAMARHRRSVDTSAHDFMGTGNFPEIVIGKALAVACAGGDAGGAFARKQIELPARACDSGFSAGGEKRNRCDAGRHED